MKSTVDSPSGHSTEEPIISVEMESEQPSEILRQNDAGMCEASQADLEEVGDFGDAADDGIVMGETRSENAGPTKGRRFGRPISFILEVFTTEKEPWKLRQAECLHCKKIVSYHKKSEYVLVHLNRCAPFLKFCKEENKMELMYFVIRHMEEASRVKRMRRREEKIIKQGGTLPAKERSAIGVPAPIDLQHGQGPKQWQLIDLVDSCPAADCIPARLLHECATELLKSGEDANSSNPNSDAVLFNDSCKNFGQALAPFLRKCSGRRNINPELILPVKGVADALHILITMQLKHNDHRPGGFVFVEEYTQAWVCDIFQSRGLALRTLTLDAHGLIVDDLRMQLQAYEHERMHMACSGQLQLGWPMMLYIMPSFNNPTGSCLSPQRRLDLLELTRAAGLIVVSDDTFSLLDFSWEIKMLQIKDRHKVYGHYPGAANPIGALGADKVHELKSLVDFSEYRNVISVSSFSKTISSDLSLGWIETTDIVLFDNIKSLALQITDGSMSYFTANVVARCLQKDHANGEATVAAHIMKQPDLYRHICDIKNTYAKRYHHLTNALIRYSNMLLPPGGLNQLRIEGYCDYPDGHADNAFQITRGGVMRNEADHSQSEKSAYDTEIPQWKARTGGYYIWVRLPAWVRPRPVYAGGMNGVPPTAYARAPDGSFYLLGPEHVSLGPPSLQWFIEKAQNEFSLDFKLDIECTPVGPNVSYTPFLRHAFPGDPAAAFMAMGPCSSAWRHVRMCFVKYNESVLEEAAERFVTLLASVYAECAPTPYGYGF